MVKILFEKGRALLVYPVEAASLVGRSLFRFDICPSTPYFTRLWASQLPLVSILVESIQGFIYVQIGRRFALVMC